MGKMGEMGDGDEGRERKLAEDGINPRGRYWLVAWAHLLGKCKKGRSHMYLDT